MANILGKLPASNSPAGSLDTIDWMKTVRLGIVALGGAFVVAFGQSIFAYCDAQVAGYCDLTAVMNWKVILGDAAQAGVTALGAAAMELFRRFVTAN